MVKFIPNHFSKNGYCTEGLENKQTEELSTDSYFKGLPGKVQMFIIYIFSLFLPNFNLSLGASSGVETLEQFFARLKKKNNWTDQGKIKAVLLDLRSKEINTVEALKELWEQVKPELPLSLGMKRILEEEIQNV